MRSESCGEDLTDDSAELGQVHYANHRNHDDVDGGHDRRHPLGHASDGLNSAEDHHCGEHKEKRSDDQVCAGQASQSRDWFTSRGAQSGQKSRSNGVGLHRRNNECAGHNGDDGENAGQNLVLHPEGNVVRRTAAEGSVSGANLKDLGKRGLEEGGRHADDGNDPHPEDCTRATHEKSNGHAENVTDTHARSQRDREGLEGGNPSLCATSGAGDRSDHLGELANLHEPRAQSQVQTGSDEDPHCDVQGNPVSNVLDGLCEVRHSFLQYVRGRGARARQCAVAERVVCAQQFTGLYTFSLNAAENWTQMRGRLGR